MIAELLQNEFFSAGVGASLVASALYALRALPEKVGDLLSWRFTSSVTVHNEDPAFERMSEWLATLGYAKRARKLRLTTSYVEEGESTKLLTPGIGYHLIWHDRRPFLLERVEQAKEGSFFMRETYHLRCVGGPKPLHALVDVALRSRTAGEMLPCFLFHGYWKRVASKRVRPLTAVILAEGQRESIIADIEWFLGARAWYEERCLPYRRGYLFKGPAGTGKTTLAMAIAKHVGRPLYVLHLGGLESDNQLFAAILNVPAEAVLLLDDFDTVQGTKSREADVVEQKPDGMTSPKTEQKGVTLGGLLNALDGAFTRDGRICIMNTNKPDAIDPALLRPGRVDVPEMFDLFGREDALRLLKQLRPSVDPEELLASLKFPVSPAAIQGLVQGSHGRSIFRQRRGEAA